jgi:hypothetical protein
VASNFPRFTLLSSGLEPARPSVEIARRKLEASRPFPTSTWSVQNLLHRKLNTFAEAEYQVSG